MCKWRTSSGNCAFHLSKIFLKECQCPNCPNVEIKEKYEKGEIIYTEELSKQIWRDRHG